MLKAKKGSVYDTLDYIDTFTKLAIWINTNDPVYKQFKEVVNKNGWVILSGNEINLPVIDGHKPLCINPINGLALYMNINGGIVPTTFLTKQVPRETYDFIQKVKTLNDLFDKFNV